MGQLVLPQVYFVGETVLNLPGLTQYLRDSGNEDFLEALDAAVAEGLTTGEALCSFYAKLCYASLSLGKNKNVSKVRDIPDNLRACFDAGHGSVFEHCQLNFVVRNCSRVLTHELVRHRVGTAFSQTSGRYVRGDNLDLVFDPILEPIRHKVEELQAGLETWYRQAVAMLGLEDLKDFDRKKKLTSALRRLLPNGQANEIGFSVNLRSLRHLVMLRTSRHAEWEIRHVVGQVYRIVQTRYPLVFRGARETTVDGLLEVTGMKLQPYDGLA